MRLRRLRGGVRGAVVVAVGVLASVMLAAGSASAHVSVTPDSWSRVASRSSASRCRTSLTDANTVGLEVAVPTKHPIAFVSVKPMPGWTITTEKTTLAKPVKGEGGEITEAVSKVTWTATAGGLEPGQFDLFTISAGPLPTKAGTLAFKAIQTYSDGEIVRWIQPTVKGAPEPELPAPTLTLTASGGERGRSLAR